MKRAWLFIVIGFIGFGIEPVTCLAHELTGEIAVEIRKFFDDALHTGQPEKNDMVSGALKLQYYHEWENGSNVVFTPFGRIDDIDSRRSHYDIRELNYQHVADTWYLRLGLGKVFWGATEFVHLVDIINQTDLVENIDGESKLGQPMAHLSVAENWGILDLFLLPGFRERTFPGRKGRLRASLVIDTDHAEYENEAKDRHVDWAVRYSRSLGNMDLGLYHFQGTGREPTLLLRLDGQHRPMLIPYYEQIDQTGMDLQLNLGNWLIKQEALYRAGQGDEDFFACVSGFEYAFVGIGGSKIDLSLVGEYSYDGRDTAAANPYQNDGIAGVRINVNDMASTEVLTGLAYDLDNASKVFSLEASRRVGERLKVRLQSLFFFDSAEEDRTFDLRNDDYAQLEFLIMF